MKRPASTRPPSQRTLRVGELIRHALAEILARGDVADDDLAGVIVTIPEVQMTPDLKLATCFVMPLGQADPRKTVAALERNRKFLRGEVAHRVQLRHAPDLRFRVDTSFDTGARIDALLRSPSVQRDLHEQDGDDAGDTADPHEKEDQTRPVFRRPPRQST